MGRKETKGRTPKANYKIFDKLKGKYVSAGYRSKSTWSSVAWVMLAAEEYAKNINRTYIENIEIHVFPVESAIKFSYTEMKATLAEKELEKKAKSDEYKNRAKLNADKRRIAEEWVDLAKKLYALRNEGLTLGMKLDELEIIAPD